MIACDKCSDKCTYGRTCYGHEARDLGVNEHVCPNYPDCRCDEAADRRKYGDIDRDSE